jgi:hypothetical protein
MSIIGEYLHEQYGKKIKELKEDIKFLMSFVPEWAKKSEPGLCATMYGTLSYEGDLKVIERVNKIRNKLK